MRRASTNDGILWLWVMSNQVIGAGAGGRAIYRKRSILTNLSYLTTINLKMYALFNNLSLRYASFYL